MGTIQPSIEIEGYRVLRVIGRGGMGVVYEAVQSPLDRKVALKVLRPELAGDPAFVERFRHEGRLQASIEHPNVLDVYEVGQSGEGLFLAMRLVSGRTLLDLLRNGELDATTALDLLGQVGGALDAAHEAGLVHRDVKPQNVLVDRDGKAYLADFGLTRASGIETTAGGSRPMLGSVAYVAPEIVAGEQPTPASDRYSLAATLFHCLTGDVPFPRGSDAAVLYAHAAEPPPATSGRRPELPEAIDAPMAEGLAKRPADRPPTGLALVTRVRDALGVKLGSLGPPHPPPAFEVPSGYLLPPGRPGRRIPLPVLLLALLVAAVAGAAAVYLLDGEGPPEAPVPAVPEQAIALGSTLGSAPGLSLDCRGRTPDQDSPSCSISQSELPGEQLLVPEDGVITGWSVRGARGELALDVIRPRGGDTLRVARSQWESAGNDEPYRFPSRIPVEAGDRIGVELGPGASIGVDRTEGATTDRWLEPAGGAYGLPDKVPGSGFDYEVALRAELKPGKQLKPPRTLTGVAAERAPAGKVRGQAGLTVDEPRRQDLKLKLVELDDRVVLDVLESGRRTLRAFIPGLVPGGIPVELESYEYPGETFGEADIWWVNPNSGRAIFNYLLVRAGHLEGAG